MLMKIERYITEVMKGKQKGGFATFLRAGLWTLSLPYHLIVRLRNWAYDKEWFKQYHPPIPSVVSVGNIVAGGTGKTPFVLLLAREFYEDFTLGILSRGYRSPAEKLPSPITLSAGKGPLHSAAYCGDEPYLLAENLPKANIYVGKDRQKSSILAAKAGVELAIVDDGMQYRRLERDYEIVVMDVEDPLGQNHHLPRGFLREHPNRLSSAHLVVLNHVKEKALFESGKKIVEKYTKAPIIGTALECKKFYDLQGQEVDSIEKKNAAVFCGIGQPNRLVQTLKELGVTIVGEQFFADHAPLYSEQIIRLASFFKEKGAELLICTEKDKVKIPEIPDLCLPIVWLKMKLRVVENEEGWKAFIEKLKQDLNNRTFKGTDITNN